MSLVIYRGPSAYDPAVQILAVLVTDSSNRKTGRMAQVFILRADTAPHTAQRLGLDEAVCGRCPLRPIWPLSRARPWNGPITSPT